MKKNYIGVKFEEFKDKFNRYFLHKKKVRALENYASVHEFAGARFINMIKEILNTGFLDDKEEAFLEHQIEKAEIDALTWSHKTRWLKQEMKRVAAESGSPMMAKKPVYQQMMFPYDDMRPIVPAIPTHLLATKKVGKAARI